LLGRFREGLQRLHDGLGLSDAAEPARMRSARKSASGTDDLAPADWRPSVDPFLRREFGGVLFGSAGSARPSASTSLMLVDARHTAGSVQLAWSYRIELGEDQWFEVRLWKKETPAFNRVFQTKEAECAVEGDLPAGDYGWSVAVIG